MQVRNLSNISMILIFSLPKAAGKGIADQDRNILSNQMLLLDFLRSAAPFLRGGPVPGVMRSRKRKGGDSDSEEEAPMIGAETEVTEDI